MADIMTPAQRSEVMSRIKGKDTTPEMIVRKLLHSLGYRYRLHDQDLPGQPDIVFRGKKKIIFVHGCFWHQHPGCKRAAKPKSNIQRWNDKLAKNKARDRSQIKQLMQTGWVVCVIWECEVKDQEALAARLVTFLEDKIPE